MKKNSNNNNNKKRSGNKNNNNGNTNSTTTTTTSSPPKSKTSNNNTTPIRIPSSSITPPSLIPSPNKIYHLGNLIGMDMGGSLSKICLFAPYTVGGDGVKALLDFVQSETTYGGTGVREESLSFESTKFGGRFHFIRFETSRTKGAVEMLKRVLLSSNTSNNGYRKLVIHATGGGALKYAQLFETELGVKLEPEDELETILRGIVFIMMEYPETCYAIKPAVESQSTVDAVEGVVPMHIRVPSPIKAVDELFPFLVVNIGSGVSIVKVDSPSSMRRVSGTAVGGGTYFGLCKLLTRCETFEEAMDMADRGDSRRVNMLVSDIYGEGGYNRVGLPGSVTASFFGKAASALGATRPASSGSHEDIIEARRDEQWFRILRTTASFHAPAAALAVYFGEIIYPIGGGLITLLCVCIIALTVDFVRRNRRRARKQILIRQGSSNTTATTSTTTPSPNISLLRPNIVDGKEVVFRDEDIARALVTMVAQNVTQLAYLNAKIHKTKRIVFTGNFLRHNAIALRVLTTNLTLWSGGDVQAVFMEHEGYFGALGAFLSSVNDERNDLPVPPPRVSRTGSLNLPETGDDAFHLSPAGGGKPMTGAKSLLDVMADLRLT
jgi:type II pantothenate kinase